MSADEDAQPASAAPSTTIPRLRMRAARALTGLSQPEVAAAAGVSVPTLKRAEAGGPIKVADETVQAIARALEKAGVEFIPENGGGAGVRLRKRGKK